MATPARGWRLGRHHVALGARGPGRRTARGAGVGRGAQPVRAADEHLQHRHRHDRADAHRPRHPRAARSLPQRDGRGPRGVVSAVERARRRQRPRVALVEGGARRRALRTQRPEGLDERGALLRLRPGPVPQRPERPEAPRHHRADRRHALPRHRHPPPAPDHGRRALQRGVLRRGPRAGRKQCRRGARGLASRTHHDDERALRGRRDGCRARSVPGARSSRGRDGRPLPTHARAKRSPASTRCRCSSTSPLHGCARAWLGG